MTFLKGVLLVSNEPLLSDQLPFPRGRPLNRGSSVFLKQNIHDASFISLQEDPPLRHCGTSVGNNFLTFLLSVRRLEKAIVVSNFCSPASVMEKQYNTME